MNEYCYCIQNTHTLTTITRNTTEERKIKHPELKMISLNELIKD